MTGSLVVVVVALVAVLLGVRQAQPGAKEYCAAMPDAVGVFDGNAVTRRGVTVGKVTKIESRRGHAVVTFTVDGDERLPADVKAATVAPSIIAVRQLALIGDYHGGAQLPPGQCIDLGSTATPVSISRSLQSVSDLAEEMTLGGGPQQAQRVLGSMSSLDRELAGTGPLLNAMIKQLAKAPHTPMVGGLVDTARVIDNVSSLTTGLAGNWKLLQDFITTAAPLAGTMAVGTVDQLASLIKSLPDVLNVTARLMSRYSHFLWPAVDAVVPVARLVGAGMRNWGDLLGIVPVFIRAFDMSWDQKSLGLRIRYTPPSSTRIPAKNPGLTCANINRIVPGQCHVVGPDAIEVDGLRALLLMTGAAR
ncbi:MlaD family protein [Gordonia sp. CPCC 206044]|uniref:MlaD family protein n=1 Tax=Gordonia sp. CPCC 206044 TaxID=3140793 RepID=UPI003AF33BD6